MFIETTDPEDATGDTAAVYDRVAANWGFVPNWAKVFAVRPDMDEAWTTLIGTLSTSMDRRRYELATLAAAQTLGSTYCALAHTRVLRNRFHDPEEIAAIVEDVATAPALDDTDRAVMSFAAQVVDDATAITQHDIDVLRERGLGDGDILDVAMAAAARSFFAKVLDAMGARADSLLVTELGPELTSALIVGRSPEVT